MITPDELKLKAERIYPKAFDAWLSGDDCFFPKHVPADLKVPKEASERIRAVNEIRENSKEKLGFGYRVHWEHVNSRSKGNNPFPSRLEFEEMDDLVRFLGKQREHARLMDRCGLLLSRFPVLRQWLTLHWSKLLVLNDSLEDLVSVTEYMQRHPRPNCYPRELPLAVSTKLVERNERLLDEWWTRVLPSTAIDFGSLRFAEKFGFRSPRPHLLLRVLDPCLLSELPLPTDELSLPAEALAKLPVCNARIMIVENKMNLLTLPPMKRTLALGGLGFGVSQLFALPWLRETLLYWGDIDLDGFEILALLRRKFPHAESCFMDGQVLRKYRHLAMQWKCEWKAPPPELTEGEREAFEMCRDEQLRLEQEHLPQMCGGCDGTEPAVHSNPRLTSEPETSAKECKIRT